MRLRRLLRSGWRAIPAAAIVFFFMLGSACAQEGRQEEVPMGMEKVKIGNSELVLPKGAKYHKVGDLVVVEGSSEYVARRMQLMDERLAKIEAEIRSLAAKTKELEDAVLALKEKDKQAPVKKELPQSPAAVEEASPPQ